MNELITIESPRGDIAKAGQICTAILKRRDEIAAEIDANPVTEENWNAPETTETQKRLKGAVEELRDKGKELIRCLVEEAAAYPILTAIDPRFVTFSTKGDPRSAYDSLSARLKERAEAIKGFKAAANTEPVEQYYIGVSCTKSQLKKIVAAIEKAGGEVEYTEKKKDEVK